MVLTVLAWVLLPRTAVPRRLRLRLRVIELRRWDLPAREARTFPVQVTWQRFLAALLVLVLGIVGFLLVGSLFASGLSRRQTGRTAAGRNGFPVWREMVERMRLGLTTPALRTRCSTN